jgi:hypothetical protein
LKHFDQLHETHRLVHPLNTMKAAFLAKFPAALAVQIKCFDDWIARSGTVPARHDTADVASANSVRRIVDPEGMNPQNYNVSVLFCALISLHNVCIDLFFTIDVGFCVSVTIQGAAFNATMPSEMLTSFIIFLSSIWFQFTDSTYHKYFTVVQSSGWGKTRLMDLLCETYQRVLIYACFRSTDSPASGYPRGVKAVTDAFEAIQTRALGTRLGACENLLRAVVQLACSARTFQGGLIDDPESQSYEDLWKQALALSATETFNSEYGKWLSSPTVRAKFGPMKQIQDSKADNFKVFLVFDELSHLLRSNFDIVVTASEWELKEPAAVPSFAVTAFLLLCRALYNLQSELVHLGVAAVFIDTHSSISNFQVAPTSASETSARDLGVGSPLPLPVYWQINAEPTMFTGLDLFLFGRPMIGGYYNAVQATAADVVLCEAAFIQRKQANVIRLCEIKMQDPSMSREWVAATMCCLLDLEVRAGSALPDVLIRSYMVR